MYRLIFQYLSEMSKNRTKKNIHNTFPDSTVTYPNILSWLVESRRKEPKLAKWKPTNVSLRIFALKLQKTIDSRILKPENYIFVCSVETMDEYSRRLCCWMFVFMYLSLLRTRSKLNSWRYWMSGPRQLITGLSRDATLDREREPGGHTHKNMQHQHTAMSHEPTPQTHLLCSQWQDVSNWGDHSVTGKIKALQWHKHTHLSPGCDSRTRWLCSLPRQTQTQRCPSSLLWLCRQPERWRKTITNFIYL